MRFIVRTLLSVITVVCIQFFITPTNAWAVPGQVTNVQASDGTWSDRIRIAWNPVSGTIRYLVFRSTSSADRCVGGYVGNPLATTNFFDDFPTTSGTFPSSGTIYHYTVQALDLFGQGGQCSTPDSGWRSPPNPPSNVSASDGTYDDKIHVTWSHPPTGSPVSYYLYESTTNSACTDANPLELGGGTTGIYVFNITPGQYRYYSLKAVGPTSGPSGESSCSAVNAGHIGITISGSLGTTGATMGISGVTGLSSCNISGSSYSCAPIPRTSTVTITPNKSGWTFNPASQVFSSISANQTFNFSSSANTYSISGSLGTTGASVSATGGSCNVTGSSYSCTGIQHGNNTTVTPQKTGYTFTPGNRQYNNVTQNFTQQNFSAAANTYTISGTLTFNGIGMVGTTLSSSALGSTTTGFGGAYSYNNVSHGTVYTITPQLSVGVVGYSPPSVTNTLTGPAQHNFAAIPATYAISGTITHNGSPVAGVTVNLNGQSPATTTTNTSGFYIFNNISHSTSYTVVPQPNAVIESFSPPNASGVLLGAATHNFNSIFRSYTISGTVTENGNPLSGVTINGGSLSTVTTNGQGFYSFSGVEHGTQYLLTPSKAGYGFSPSVAFGTVTGAVTANFTATQSIYSISGVVTHNGNPLSGVLVSGGTIGSSTTDNNGHYSIGNIPSGTAYNINASKTGYTFSPNSFNGTLTSNVTHNFSATLNIYSISGTVTLNGTPLEGVTINGGALGTRTTNALGQYFYLTVDHNTAYTITASLTGYAFAPPSYTGTLTAHLTANFAASATAHTLSGTVRVNTLPLAGVTINGGALGTRTTNAQGQYSYLNVPQGTAYVLVPSLTGYSFSPAQASGAISGPTTADFNATLNTYTISGAVTLNGSPLQGVTINGGALGTRTTNAQGQYSYTSVPHNTVYTLAASLTGYGFTPASHTGTLTGNLTANFTASLNTHTLSGTVRVNTLPLAGVTINGGTLGTRTTNTQGQYSFLNVPQGTAYVLVPSLTGYGFSPAQASGTISGPTIADFNATLNTYTISGAVTLNGVGLSGITISAGAFGSTITNAQGQYAFASVPHGTVYSLSAAQTGYSFSPATHSGTLTGNVSHNFIASQTVFSISGTVTVNGTALSGVTIGGGALGTMTTNASGQYSFPGVAQGTSYSLTPQLATYQFTPASVSGTLVSDVTHNFTALPNTPTFTISGRVSFANNAPASGVLVTDGTRNAQSDTNGDYILSNVPNGSYTLVATRVGYIISPNVGTNPAVVNGQNLAGENFTATCIQDFELVGGLCVPKDGTPVPPQNLSASDGTSTEEVAVTWSLSQGALSYQVYRSEFAGDQGVSVGNPVQTTFYNDRSAIPGVRYFYSVTATNSAGESLASSQDEGYRADKDSPCFDQGGDSDGDGVCDDQEIIDGTDPHDRGSFQLHLKSPAFTKYNTFLGQTNFLELIANGTKPVTPIVTIYSINGQVIDSKTVPIDSLNQVDLNIHDIVGPDTYGVIKITWDDKPGKTLAGRMSNYRLNADKESYSFAFAKELRNPIRGRTYATGNSFDPIGLGYLVPNWAEIVNLDNKTRKFTYRLYNQAGEILSSQVVQVPALGERDVQAGHEAGEGAYLAEFIPDDGATDYFATVTRYSSNAPGGQVPETYNFAFPLDARAGNGDKQYALISNDVGSCWSQTNWFEVINVREKPITAHLTFRGKDGEKIDQTSYLLDPMSQYHFNASALLDKGQNGTVILSASDPGSLIAQSSVYYHDCADNILQAGYSAPARIPGQDVQAGTVNTFLGMNNILTLISTTKDETALVLEVRSFGELLSEQEQTLDGYHGLGFDLNDANIFGTAPDIYGTLTLRTDGAQKVLAEILRLREVNGRVDFAMPTAIQ